MKTHVLDFRWTLKEVHNNYLAEAMGTLSWGIIRKENIVYLQNVHVLWFKIFFGLKGSNRLIFVFPLSQNLVMNTEQQVLLYCSYKA